MRDLKLTADGQWEPIDVLAGMEDDDRDLYQWLDSQGWDEFLDVGVRDSGVLYIATWRRQHDDAPTQYLLEVGGGEYFSHFLMTESLVDLMDLVSRWSPAVQAAAIADTVHQLSQPHLVARGLVETIAARAAVGSTETAEELVRQRKLDREARDRARRARSTSTNNG